MKKPKKTDYLDDGIKIALNHKSKLDRIHEQAETDSCLLSESIRSSEELLVGLGKSLPEPDKSSQKELYPKNLTVQDWDSILKEAEDAYTGGDCFDLLSKEEVEYVLKQHNKIGSDLNWFKSLDRYDFALSIAAGIISGLVDIFCVKVPHLPAGATAEWMANKGGLSGIVEKSFGKILPPKKIEALEKAYKVPYDITSNADLLEHVSGLYPRTHRLQSLGHDPVLGFFFGVRDILQGEFTAIGSDGVFIMQKVSESFMSGENLFVRLFEAIKLQAGHIVSDVGTPQGVPPPLFPLLQFCKFGKIGNNEHSVAEIARYMYTKGYDFRHFVSCSLPVMLIEVIIRVGYFVRSLCEGKEFSECIPIAPTLRLRRQLLIAHGTATLINSGKVYVTNNIFGISLPQIYALLRYLLPELMYLINGKERTRQKIVESEIMSSYQSIISDLDHLQYTFSEQIVI